MAKAKGLMADTQSLSNRPPMGAEVAIHLEFQEMGDGRFYVTIFRVERARQSLVNLFERGRVVRDGELAMWEVRWWPAYEGTIGGMPAVDRAVSARAAVAVDR